jgi:hypothetical protein
MQKLTYLICAMVLGSILAGCVQTQPQRQYQDNETSAYKDGR